VNLGGEPERDDSGLPPVDIEIPDDARELDRDVQAYRRELRARRRRERRMRLHAPLTRDGVVLPLLASCLVLALIAGTLLTVFTAGPNGEGDLPGAARTPHAAASHSLSSSRSGSPAASANSPVAAPRDSPTATPSKHKLPNQPIVSAGQRVLLPSLVNRGSLVIALVPAECACVATVQRLVHQVLGAGLRMYLVSAKGQLSAVQPLQRQDRKAVVIAEDVSGALYSDYAGHGLTALLVHPGGSVGTVALSGQTFTLTTQLAELSQEADSAQTSSPTTTSSPR
jgi:hypothetical protein